MDSASSTKVWKWADGPFPLIETPKHKAGQTGYTDPYMETASTMCVVHNTLLRGLNSIYNQGPHLRPADYADFIGYSLCWYSVVHDHHTSEEDQFFPDIEEAVGEKGLLDGNVQQHRSFHAGLEEYNTYLLSLAGKESTFSATHLNTIISSFAPALHSHLTTEIADLLDLAKYGTRLPIAALWDKEGKHAVTSMTKFKGLPFFFLNIDLTHEESLWKNWPPIPWIGRWVIVNCFAMWHRGYWKFATCDRSGKPKALYARGS